jgi:hypothetical protein
MVDGHGVTTVCHALESSDSSAYVRMLLQSAGNGWTGVQRVG